MVFTSRLALVTGLVPLMLVGLAGGCRDDDDKKASALTAPPTDPGLAKAIGDGQPFIPVYRTDTRAIDLAHAEAIADLPAGAMEAGRGFYLAVDKRALDQPWFLSAFLKQYYNSNGDTFLDADSGNGGLFYSLGNRVVSFAIHAGKLYVFDRDSRKSRSDVLDPEVLVDAYPLVAGYAAFDRAPGSERYVLIDPSAGLSRFGVEASSALFVTDGALAVDLALAQRFRRIDDGITFEKIFSGSYTRSFAAGGRVINARASGTLGLAIRRYVEGDGFRPTASAPRPFYFTTRSRPVINEGRNETALLKWNIKPGMAPIKWLVTASVDAFGKNPALAGYDVFGAIKRGIEGWNEAIGFPVFVAEKAGPKDELGQDDKNFFIVNPDPRRSSAFADARYNPNTGEIRGASVHFYSGFIDLAIAEGLAGTTPTPLPARTGAAEPDVTLTWAGAASEHLCDVSAPPGLAGATPAEDQVNAALVAVSPQDRVERMISFWAAHEVGHTLGLRHNFRGSLRPPTSSVMDYVAPAFAAASWKPGVYDAQAVKFLYGLSPTPPTEPFCTDSGVGRDTRCFRHDGGADPLKEFYGPRYAATLAKYLASGDTRDGDRLFNPQSAQFGYGAEVLSFLRVAESAAEMVTAWGFATAGLYPPIPRERLADRAFVSRVDRTTAQVLTAVFAAVPGAAPPGPLPADPDLMTAVAGMAKSVLLNLDGARSYPTRRIAAGFLRNLQHLEGYKALRGAREALAQGRALLPPDDQLYTDDLLAGIDRALAPYFD